MSVGLVTVTTGFLTVTIQALVTETVTWRGHSNGVHTPGTPPPRPAPQQWAGLRACRFGRCTAAGLRTLRAHSVAHPI
jgi:hypothetical protein